MEKIPYSLVPQIWEHPKHPVRSMKRKDGTPVARPALQEIVRKATGESNLYPGHTIAERFYFYCTVYTYT